MMKDEPVDMRIPLMGCKNIRKGERKNDT